MWFFQRAKPLLAGSPDASRRLDSGCRWPEHTEACDLPFAVTATYLLAQGMNCCSSPLSILRRMTGL
jgi:hypothetical protein